jgi:hypothetical protein
MAWPGTTFALGRNAASPQGEVVLCTGGAERFSQAKSGTGQTNILIWSYFFHRYGHLE